MFNIRDDTLKFIQDNSAELIKLTFSNLFGVFNDFDIDNFENYSSKLVLYPI